MIHKQNNYLSSKLTTRLSITTSQGDLKRQEKENE